MQLISSKAHIDILMTQEGDLKPFLVHRQCYLDEYTDLEKIEYLQNMLISRATGGDDNSQNDYKVLRDYVINHPTLKGLCPSFIKTNRSLDQFWGFIQPKFETYKERRQYIYGQFVASLDFLEGKQAHPANQSIDEVLSQFSEDSIHRAWQKALERKSHDPDGAITMARSIIESVCKHILHDRGVSFDENRIELSDLYKATAKELNMSPEQHSEQVFKQILGGCSGVVNGLGTLRNKHGDAHGDKPKSAKPKKRHAELAVNLAGAMALFLVETHLESHRPEPTVDF